MYLNDRLIGLCGSHFPRTCLACRRPKSQCRQCESQPPPHCHPKPPGPKPQSDGPWISSSLSPILVSHLLRLLEPSRLSKVLIFVALFLLPFSSLTLSKPLRRTPTSRPPIDTRVRTNISSVSPAGLQIDHRPPNEPNGCVLSRYCVLASSELPQQARHINDCSPLNSNPPPNYLVIHLRHLATRRLHPPPPKYLVISAQRCRGSSPRVRLSSRYLGPIDPDSVIGSRRCYPLFRSTRC